MAVQDVADFFADFLKKFVEDPRDNKSCRFDDIIGYPSLVYLYSLHFTLFEKLENADLLKVSYCQNDAYDCYFIFNYANMKFSCCFLYYVDDNTYSVSLEPCW